MRFNDVSGNWQRWSGRSTRRLAMPSPGRRGIGGAEEAADQVPAAVDAHLVEQDFEVVLHGVPGDVQGVGDGAGWLPAQDEGGDLCFAGGQAVRYEQEGGGQPRVEGFHDDGDPGVPG